MYTYYISVGSNMGDKEATSVLAFNPYRIMMRFQMVTSPLIETEPWGYTDQDIFVNGVWSCESTLDPSSNVKSLQSELERGLDENDSFIGAHVH